MVVGQNMIYRQTNGIGSQINNCVFDRSHLLTEKYMRCLFLLFLFYQIYVKSKRKFVSNLCEIVVIGKDFFGTIRMAGSGFGYQVDLFRFIYYNKYVVLMYCKKATVHGCTLYEHVWKNMHKNLPALHIGRKKQENEVLFCSRIGNGSGSANRSVGLMLSSR